MPSKSDLSTNHLRSAARRANAKDAELLRRAADEIDGMRKHVKTAEAAHHECKDLLIDIALELGIAVDSPYDLDEAVPEYAAKVAAMRIAVAAARDEHRARTAYRDADAAYCTADVGNASRLRTARSISLNELFAAEHRTKKALDGAALTGEAVAG